MSRAEAQSAKADEHCSVHGSGAGGRAVAAHAAQPCRPGPGRPCARGSPEARARAGRQPGSRRARRHAARACQGQTRHLPVHGRRSVADGDVRLQAAAQPAQRRTAAGLGAAGPAPDGHVRQPVVAAARRFAVRVQAARPSGALGLRSPAAHGPDRRRPVHRPVDVHRGHQSRSGDHVLSDRVTDCGPAELRRLGSLRPRQRQRGPAGVRRPDHAGQGAISRCTRGCGAAAFCRRGTRACSSAAAAIRCCISTTRTGCRARTAARSSTG